MLANLPEQDDVMHPQYEEQVDPGASASMHVIEHLIVPGLHAPVAQSVWAAQSCPEAHFVGHEPPQSMSVSEPFLTPSVQLAVAQVCEAGVQTSVEAP